MSHEMEKKEYSNILQKHVETKTLLQSLHAV